MEYKFLFFSILITFLSIVLSAEDYYKLLGVSRNASDKEIKKAFKKMSIKYHPDKYKDAKEKEKAKDKFVKIANAYETLTDPNKKAAYDNGGEEGVKSHEQREASGQRGGGSFEDIFSTFFNGGGGGGQRFTFNTGGGSRGGRRHAFDDEEEEEAKHFENTDVLKLTIASLTKILNRKDIWFILCYKDKDRGIKETIEMWKTLAEKTYGIFKVGSINCKAQEELCEEFSIRDTPSILYFPEVGDEPELYKGLKTWEKIFQFGASKMQSFVRIVNKDNYGDFITSFSSNHKVLLFTSKMVTPPLLKALSKHYQGKLYFGEVRQSEVELCQRFGISKFPSLLVVSEPENHKGVSYDGPLSRDSIEKFLNKYAYETIKKEVKSSGVKELTDEVYKTECNPNDNKAICVIKIVSSGADIKSEDNLGMNLLAEEYKNDPFQFYYIITEKYGHFWTSFDEEEKNSDVIIIKGKRKKYLAIPKSDDWKKVLNAKLDTILSGSGEFKNLNKKLNLLKLRKDDL